MFPAFVEQIMTSSVKTIMKAMIETFFGGPSLGVIRIFFTVGCFFNDREYS